jgi:hypothetical protein
MQASAADNALNIFYQSETAVSRLKVRRSAHHAAVPFSRHSDGGDSGLLLFVSSIILLFTHIFLRGP